MGWTLVPCTDYEKRRGDFSKKWPHEMRAIANNFKTLVAAIEDGANPEQLKSLGFVHGNYPLGILSIDETGHEKGSKPKAIRLYLFPCTEESKLYVMLLGDKSKQSEDVALCKNFVAKKLASLKPPSKQQPGQ